MDRSSVGNVPAISGSAHSFVLKVKLALGEIHPLSLFDSNTLSCIDFFSSPFPLQILIDEFVGAAS